ncbi:unnamed protein product [Schistocephalus solidus]|uniref:RecQ-mediated genome instability protein 1 n=1 Tax=Schistocephalus solidus TaxID=70667 RepID=A0A183SW11_SCHSO|nr:unnamed protein product [Schistocephalus solidus]
MATASSEYYSSLCPSDCVYFFSIPSVTHIVAFLGNITLVLVPSRMRAFLRHLPLFRKLSQPQYASGMPTPPVDSVKAWLNAQAVVVPEEWVEACIEWLKEEHGASMCASQPASWWCEAVFEQWLHTDLYQLLCPILPSASDVQANESAFTLEGELCLQVVNAIVAASSCTQLSHVAPRSWVLPSGHNRRAKPVEFGSHPEFTAALFRDSTAYPLVGEEPKKGVLNKCWASRQLQKTVPSRLQLHAVEKLNNINNNSSPNPPPTIPSGVLPGLLSGIHRNADNTDTPCTPSAPAILVTTATPTTKNDIPPASPDFSCPQCTRNFNSRIGLVSGFINIGESYYGQLRRLDGDLSTDLPDLERHNPDFDDDHASQYPASQMSATGRRGPNAVSTLAQTMAVLLTDGVTTIKAIELGMPRRPVGNIELTTKFAPGRKVRLRGPLNIRKGVLILPCGSFSSHNAPESHFYILGGEVEELPSDPLVTATNLLRSQLMQKLGLPQDQGPPAWFPGRRRATAGPASLNPASTNVPPPANPPPPPQPEIPAAPTAVPSQADFDDDDALFATVMKELETGLHQQCSAIARDQPSTAANANPEERDLEDEVDADVLESALQDIDFSPCYVDSATTSSVPPELPPEYAAPAGTAFVGCQPAVGSTDQNPVPPKVRRAEPPSVAAKRPSNTSTTGDEGSILSFLTRRSDTRTTAVVVSSCATTTTADALSASRAVGNLFHPFGYLQVSGNGQYLLTLWPTALLVDHVEVAERGKCCAQRHCPSAVLLKARGS